MKFLKSLVAVLALGFASLSFADEKVEFTPENTVVLRGEVTAESVAKASAALITNPNDKVYLFISSPGGSIIDGNRLVSLLHSTKKEVTCVTNFAASMAFVILQACTHRMVTEDAVVMQHVAAYSLQGQEPNNYSMAQFLHRMTVKMAKLQAARIGITYEKFKALTRDDWWLFDGEAVTSHVADAQVQAVCSAELAKKTYKQTLRSMFGSAEITWSSCPLIDGPLDVKASGFLGPQGELELAKILGQLDWRENLMSEYYSTH